MTFQRVHMLVCILSKYKRATTGPYLAIVIEISFFSVDWLQDFHSQYLFQAVQPLKTTPDTALLRTEGLGIIRSNTLGHSDRSPSLPS